MTCACIKGGSTIGPQQRRISHVKGQETRLCWRAQGMSALVARTRPSARGRPRTARPALQWAIPGLGQAQARPGTAGRVRRVSPTKPSGNKAVSASARRLRAARPHTTVNNVGHTKSLLKPPASFTERGKNVSHPPHPTHYPCCWGSAVTFRRQDEILKYWGGRVAYMARPRPGRIS